GFTVGLIVLLIQFSNSPSAQAQTPHKAPISTTVTVFGPNFGAPPLVHKEDVAVFSGSRQLDVLDWTPAEGQDADLQLAILIDNFQNRFGANAADEVLKFIHAELQNPRTEISIFYAVSGSAQLVASPGRDSELMAKALGLADKKDAGSTNIYDS